MRRRLITACVFVIVIISAASVFAFNKPGHKVSGVIAYDVLLQKSPETVENVIALLKQHPYYEEHWIGELESLPATERDCGLFMLAAEWPDVVRSDKKHEEYNHPKWHYTDEPFKPAGQPESIKTLPPDEENIMTAYEKNLAVLKNESETPQNRSIALCWIFHLIGDIHQPCHTTSLFTTEYPEGDKGGNLVFIKTEPDAAAIKLHWFWDDLILESEELRAAQSRATELQKRPEFARSKLTELDIESSFEEWKDTSVKLAEEVVYCKGKMTGGPSKESAPVLPDGYLITAKATGERQIVLAGFRMADVMEKSLQFGSEHFASAPLKRNVVIKPANPFSIQARLGANIYIQTAAEYRACCLQVYKTAEIRLDSILTTANPKPAKPAVIMDLDETVLDNSAFESFLYENNLEYSDELWGIYERDYPDNAQLVPGARYFIKKAEQMGVTIVFVSNRLEKNAEPTIKALARLDVNTDSIRNRLFLKKNDASSDKTNRRAIVESQYNVLLTFGDNLRDFSETFAATKLTENDGADAYNRTIESRLQQVDDSACHWGVDWFVLPNPVYGEWDKLIGSEPVRRLRPSGMKLPEPNKR